MSLAPSSNFSLAQAPFEGFDKMVHIGMYALLALFWTTGLKRQNKSKSLRRYAFRYAVFGGILFGAIIELLQELYIASRHFEAFDLIANGIGCIFGIVLFKLIYKASYK